MFDFHAHPGTDDKDAFITILQERELDHISKTSSIGLLPWLEGIEKERIEALIKENNLLMVGEFGLDRIKGDIERDSNAFLFMAELARDYDRWAVVHSVRCNQLIIKHFKKLKIKKAIFHSFTGSYEEAKEIERCGYLISLSPRSFRTRDIGRLLQFDFILESDMKTGGEQKKVIENLYQMAYERTGRCVVERLEMMKRMIWKDNSCV